VTDRLLIMYGILPRQLFFVAAVVYSGSWDFLCGRCKQLFVSELNNAYFSILGIDDIALGMCCEKIG